ncbi:hypothetical protein E6O75_ATG06773 [Venturia nashicola]|uniref:Uncharacterized protein n=1 Tax=Venturia nashicola TaxID=86259 RepID=A0A4Z1NXD2_9PEZI|nr:hypothetical protein E6O75_ATG06773 [Venturia nashicola]
MDTRPNRFQESAGPVRKERNRKSCVLKQTLGLSLSYACVRFSRSKPRPAKPVRREYIQFEQGYNPRKDVVNIPSFPPPPPPPEKKKMEMVPQIWKRGFSDRGEQVFRDNPYKLVAKKEEKSSEREKERRGKNSKAQTYHIQGQSGKTSNAPGVVPQLCFSHKHWSAHIHLIIPNPRAHAYRGRGYRTFGVYRSLRTTDYGSKLGTCAFYCFENVRSVTLYNDDEEIFGLLKGRMLAFGLTFDLAFRTTICCCADFEDHVGAGFAGNVGAASGGNDGAASGGNVGVDFGDIDGAGSEDIVGVWCCDRSSHEQGDCREGREAHTFFDERERLQWNLFFVKRMVLQYEVN